MASLQYFQKLGWHFSPEGYSLITKEDSLKDIKEITKIACDTDIKEFGSPVLSKDLDGNILAGPAVLQIQKIRNISAPKSNESSGAAPRLLKLILSDGHTTYQAIEFGSISNINLSKTPPGTKLLVKNAQVIGSYILLKDSNANILGGNVPALVERWNVSKLSSIKHVREGFDGPPPWVPFGQKVLQSVITDRNFKSLDSGKPKEQSKDEFDAQREEAIAEAAQGAVRKVFGGGTAKPLPVKDNQRFSKNRNQLNKPQNEERKNGGGKIDKKKGREKETSEVLKPSGKISLFAFLEDKLPTNSADQEKIDELFETAQAKQARATYAEKYDASLRHRANDNSNKSSQKGNKGREKQNFDSTEKYNPKDTKNPLHDHRAPRGQNEKAPRFQRQQNTPINIPSYQNSMETIIKKTNEISLQSNTETKPQPFNRLNRNLNSSASGYMNVNKFNTHTNTNRPHSSYNPRNNNQNYGNNSYSNDNNPRPPYYKQNQYDPFYQNNQQKPRNPKYTNPQNYGAANRDTRSIPFEKPKPAEMNDLNINTPQSNNALWKWKVGDQCMAKYWEDNQFYNASITGVTPKTCMVRFNEYGNFEEVLKADCVPLVNNSNNNSSNNMNTNRQYTGSLVFRRGGHGSQPNNREYD